MGLDQSKLTELLDHRLNTSQFGLSVFDSIDSTNSYLLSSAATDYPQICIANSQTSGRGRFGKVWDSPHDKSLCLSIRHPMQQSLENLMGFSLVVALAIKSAIQPLIGKEMQLKWPNDILVENKKLCGVLIETSSTTRASIDLVIGVGMNVKAISADSYDSISLDECGLKSDYTPINLAAELISNIVHFTQTFNQEGFHAYRQSWLAQEQWLGAEVTVTMANGNVNYGRYVGIDEKGQIQIQMQNDIKIFNAGEISLRRTEI